MSATHTADVYGGTIKLCAVRPDPVNANMVFGLVVRDSRGKLHTGQRIWIADAQVEPLERSCPNCGQAGDGWCCHS